jgi:cell wall-associated NlpC family hydrolase
VSALTGGKFANGAITSAIQWWYNAEGNPTTLDKYIEENGVVDYAVDDNDKILEAASTQKIKSYKKGGLWSSDETDCSGTLTNILHKAGLRIRDITDAEARLSSSVINEKNGFMKVKTLSPGDVLVWKGHVAIYAGNGKLYTTSDNRGSFILTNIKQNYPTYKGWGAAVGFIGAYQYVGD